jgi:para-nitrobenzyl esterase
MLVSLARYAGGTGAYVLFTGRTSETLAQKKSTENSVVETNSGKVRGKRIDGVYSFRGIPYGASTAGPNRFRPPRKPEAWAGVRDALENGKIAPQVPSPGGTGPLSWRNEIPSLPQGEDCLVLNVFTPGVNDGRKRPVMFWCHGGGYRYEAGSLREFDGSHLARRGDMVVVSITNRLNIFGFLDLSVIDPANYPDSTNLAMQDVRMALEWVHENITNFGGDPGRVMVFGQSAGGGTVNTLLAMPSAQGLVHRAAVQSGANFRAISREDALKTTETVLAGLGLKRNQLDQLHSLPVDRLLAVAFGRDRAGAMRLTPVIDGKILPEQPFDPRAPEVSANVPIIVGSTGTETTYFIGAGDPSVFSLDEAGMRARLKRIVGESTESLIELYRRSRPGASASDIFFAITTDRQMRLPSITEAERKAAQKKAPAFMYLLTWETPVEEGKWKSPHRIDLPFIWDNVDTAADIVGTGPQLQPLADKMSSAWTAFAHTGNPSTSKLKWPAYTATDRATMIFDNQSRVINDPKKEERIAISKI